MSAIDGRAGRDPALTRWCIDCRHNLEAYYPYRAKRHCLRFREPTGDTIACDALRSDGGECGPAGSGFEPPEPKPARSWWRFW